MFTAKTPPRTGSCGRPAPHSLTCDSIYRRSNAPGPLVHDLVAEEATSNLQTAFCHAGAERGKARLPMAVLENGSMLHRLPYVDHILHRYRFWAISIASGSVRSWDLRSCCMVLSHMMRGRPRGLL